MMAERHVDVAHTTIMPWVQRLAAIAANRHSACGQMAPDKPIGATPKGALYDCPNNVVSIVGSNFPLSNRGNSVSFANPSRFLYTLWSSPVEGAWRQGARARAQVPRSAARRVLVSGWAA